MAIDKATLIALIAQKTGTEINPDDFTEEELGLMNNNEEEQDEQQDEEQDEQDNNEEQDEDEDSEDDNPTDALESIDRDRLDPATQMIYDALMSERQSLKQKEIGMEISNSGLHIKHKLILDRMAKNGVNLKEIRKTISDLKEFEKSNARTKTGTAFTSKTKVNKKTETNSKKEPKYGTYDFGKMLAQKKNKNTGGNK